MGSALRLQQVEQSEECSPPAKKHNITWDMIPSSVKYHVQVDPTRELMWTFIPKVACSTVRQTLGTWCVPEHPRCGEIRRDTKSQKVAQDMFNNETKWGVWYRDPAKRAQSAYRNLDDNPYIYSWFHR